MGPAPPRDSPAERDGLVDDNPFFPGDGSTPVDVSELVPTWAWTAGGLVSSARDLARFHRALLGGDLVSPASLRAMLTGVDSDWEESDRYGLGICEISAVMGGPASPCGPAWGHLGLGLGHTCVVLSSAEGGRQAVVMVNAGLISDEAWSAVSRLAWAALCTA